MPECPKSTFLAFFDTCISLDGTKALGNKGFPSDDVIRLPVVSLGGISSLILPDRNKF